MSIFHVMMTLICVFMLAVGQILFKYAAQTIDGINSPSGLLMALVTNGWFISSILVYGGATLLWIWVLRHVPLTVAYPFVAMSFVLVPLLSNWFLGEQVSMSYWVGIGLMVTGIVVTTF